MRIVDYSPDAELNYRYRGPRYPERDVVEAVVDDLASLGILPRLEYSLDRRCRVDAVVIREDRCLLIECKPYRIRQGDVRQALRYLEAGRRRWPDRQVEVVLVARELAPDLPEIEGISYLTVRR